MTNKELTDKFEAMLSEVESIASKACLAEIYEMCIEKSRDIEKPLRIAVIGDVSAGKSTLLNAFLKGRYVSTGSLATTYYVNYMRYVEQSEVGEELKIYMKDGSVVYKPLSFLTLLSDQNNEECAELRKKGIAWFEVFVNNEALRNYDLIDTAGLDSATGKDSQNTLDLVNDDYRRPDVIVYLVVKEYKEEHLNFIKEIHCKIRDKENLGGLNTISAFAQCDRLVYGMGGNYMDIANRIVKTNMQKYPDFRFHISKVFPVSAVYAQGAYMITESSFAILKKIALSSVPLKKIKSLERFRKYALDDFDSQEQMEQFVSTLEFPTVQYSVLQISNNPQLDIEELRKMLLEYSNVSFLKDYIQETYGKSSKRFKVNNLLTSLKKTVLKLRLQAFGEQRRQIQKILTVIESFEKEFEKGFTSFVIRKDFFEGKKYFNDGMTENVYYLDKDQWGKAMEALDLIDKNIFSEIEVRNAKKMCGYWQKLWEDFIMYGDDCAASKARYIYYSLKEKVANYE